MTDAIDFGLAAGGSIGKSASGGGGGGGLQKSPILVFSGLFSFTQVSKIETGSKVGRGVLGEYV